MKLYHGSLRKQVQALCCGAVLLAPGCCIDRRTGSPNVAAHSNQANQEMPVALKRSQRGDELAFDLRKRRPPDLSFLYPARRGQDNE